MFLRSFKLRFFCNDQRFLPQTTLEIHNTSNIVVRFYSLGCRNTVSTTFLNLPCLHSVRSFIILKQHHHLMLIQQYPDEYVEEDLRIEWQFVILSWENF